jgi:anti-anti-sigma regulatory factor
VETPSSELISESRLSDGRGELRLRGRLGTAEARGLWEAAGRLASDGQDVVVDASELRQLGGAPMQVLVALSIELRRRGARLTVLHAGAVSDLIALAGLTVELPQG